MSEVDYGADYLDLRDLWTRLEELNYEAENGERCHWCNATSDEHGTLHPFDAIEDDDEREERAKLREFFENESQESEPSFPGGEFNEPTLIRDSYFTEYAEELANEIGAIDAEAGWPTRHIDWDAAARELKYDYTSVTLDGVEYWVRSA